MSTESPRDPDELDDRFGSAGSAGSTHGLIARPGLDYENSLGDAEARSAARPGINAAFTTSQRWSPRAVPTSPLRSAARILSRANAEIFALMCRKRQLCGMEPALVAAPISSSTAFTDLQVRIVGCSFAIRMSGICGTIGTSRPKGRHEYPRDGMQRGYTTGVIFGEVRQVQQSNSPWYWFKRSYSLLEYDPA